jgi:TonB family protein
MLTSALLGLLLLLRSQDQPPPPPIEEEAPPTPPSDARTISGNRIKEPRKTKDVSPEWPDRARRAGLTGTVVLECVIDVDGHVQAVKVLSGHRSLADAAAAAVRKWRYTPTEVDGKAVPVIMTISVNYRLSSPPKREDLIGMVHDSDPEIRWAAVRWLGRFRPITSKQKHAVESALTDSSELVRGAAKDALAKLETQ